VNNTNNVIDINTYQVIIGNYYQGDNGTLLITTNGNGTGGIIQSSIAIINGIIVINITNEPQSQQILLINSTSLTVGNVSIIVINNFSKCKMVTAVAQEQGSQLYALLNIVSNCKSNTNTIIIGVTVSVGGALLLGILLTFIYLTYKAINAKSLVDKQFSEIRKQMQNDDSII